MKDKKMKSKFILSYIFKIFFYIIDKLEKYHFKKSSILLSQLCWRITPNRCPNCNEKVNLSSNSKNHTLVRGFCCRHLFCTKCMVFKNGIGTCPRKKCIDKLTKIV